MFGRSTKRSDVSVVNHEGLIAGLIAKKFFYKDLIDSDIARIDDQLLLAVFYKYTHCYWLISSSKRINCEYCQRRYNNLLEFEDFSTPKLLKTNLVTTYA